MIDHSRPFQKTTLLADMKDGPKNVFVPMRDGRVLLTATNGNLKVQKVLNRRDAEGRIAFLKQRCFWTEA